MLAPLKKSFFVGPGKKMKIRAYPESTIYKIKKTTVFYGIPRKRQIFFYSDTKHCANLIISPTKERYFLCWYGICENSKIPYQQRKYFVFFGYGSSQSSFLFGISEYPFLDTTRLFCWPS